MAPWIFLVGVGRSGTTLLGLMIEAQGDIAIPYESNFFVRFYERRHEYDLASRTERARLLADLLDEPRVRSWDESITFSDLDPDGFEDLPGALTSIYREYARRRQRSRWADKTPGHTVQIPTLRTLFPESKFVHLYRDGRDVALSSMSQNWFSTTDLVTQLRSWRRQVAKARADLAELPAEDWMSVKYEDLVVEPARVLEQVCSFLGCSFEADLVGEYTAFAARKLGRRTEREHRLTLQPPTTGRVCRWRRELPPVDLAIADEDVGELLQELGYPLSGVTPKRIGQRRFRHFLDRLQKGLRRRIVLLQTGGKKPPDFAPTFRRCRR